MDTEEKRQPLQGGDIVIDSSTGIQYEIIDVLGMGGSSIVYRAKANGDNLLLKELFPHIRPPRYYTRTSDGKIIQINRMAISPDDESLIEKYAEKLEYEHKVGKYISDHAPWVAYTGQPFTSDKGNIYAPMSKNTQGVSLRSILEDERSSRIKLRGWVQFAYILTQTVKGIHDSRILHLDISPNNIMIICSNKVETAIDRINSHQDLIGEHYDAQMIDFGSAVETDEYMCKESDGKSPTTEGYSAMELELEGGELNPATDIYSICSCLRTFRDRIPADEYDRLPVTVRAKIEQIIIVGTARDQLYRYQSSDVLLDRLHELLDLIDGRGVNKAILWETGRKEIERLKNSADFDIIPAILPSGKKSTRLTEYAHLKDGEPKKLEELIDETRGSTYLIGEGGIGKTTSLIHYADDLYGKGYTEEDTEVPIFIELSNCRMPDAKDTSHLIHRYIISKITGGTLEDIRDDPIDELERLFKKISEKPEYILMMDGLNEVSSVRESSAAGSFASLIVGEITKLIDSHTYPNVRVILTSRNDNEALSDSKFQRIYITGLGEKEVEKHLDESGVSDEKKAAAKSNPALMELLRVPLFLCIYTRIADNVDASELSTRGELLDAFFRQKREDIYTQLGKVDRLSGMPLEGYQYAFILEHILPQICWRMVFESTMELDRSRMAALIREALSEKNPIYRGFDEEAQLITDAEALAGCDDREAKEIRKKILDEIHRTLSVFYYKGKDPVKDVPIYKVRHQHFRDYFAAMHMIDLMRSARASMSESQSSTDAAFEILKEIRDRVVSPDVLTFVGEVLGEHRNSPVLVDGKWQYNVPVLDKPQDRNLIKRMLDVFRGRFDDSGEYGVFNLIEVLKKVRKDLSRADLHELDLTMVKLNKVDLGERGGDAIFKGVKITRNNIFPMGHTSLVYSAVYSSNGRQIVTASADGTAKVWDAYTGSLLLTLMGHISAIQFASYSPDSEKIVTASRDGTAMVWDVDKNSLLLTLVGHKDQIFCASYSPDGRRIVTASADGTAKIWDSDTGLLLLTLVGHTSNVFFASYSPDMKYIVTASSDKTTKVWDADTGSLRRTLSGHENLVVCSAYDIEGRYIVTASKDKTARVWDADTGALLLTLVDHTDGVCYAAYSPDSKRIVTSSWDKTAKIWAAGTGSLLLTLTGHTGCVYCASYSPDGRHIVTASYDNTVKVWDANTGSLLLTLEKHSKWINSASYSPDGRRFVTASGDGTAKVWDADTDSPLLTLEGHSEWVNSASYSPDGRHIVTASDDKTTRVWNADTGSLLLTFANHTYEVNYVAYSPDSRHIVTTYWNGTVKVWDAETGSLRLTLASHKNRERMAMSVIYSPDGKYIVTTSVDCTAKVWDADTGSLLLTLVGHNDWVFCAAYSPDGRRIITASGDNTAKVWDADTGMLLMTLTGHTSTINCALYSPDGRYIFTASMDSTAKVWDADTGSFLVAFKGPTGSIRSAAYSPDGIYIITVSKNHTTKIWNATTGECLDTIPNISGLRVVGVDMRHLHPDSHFSDKDKEILRRYGAIID